MRVNESPSATQAGNAMVNFTSSQTSPFWLPRSRRRSAIQRIGRKWDESLSIDQNLGLAGMSHPIELMPAPIDLGNGIYAPTKNKHIVMTTPGANGDKYTSFGIVAGKYKPLQTADFIKNFDFLFDDYPPHSLVNVGGGRHHGLLLRPQELPRATVLREDMEVGYLLMNDRSGKGGISIRPIVQRLVCTNGMVAMHMGKQAVIRMAHSERGFAEMERRKQLMNDLHAEPGEVLKTYEILAKTHVSTEEFREVVEAVHTMPKKPVQLIQPGKYSQEERQSAQASFESTMKRIESQRAVVMELNEYENDTARADLRGTAWLGWQALVEEADYNHHAGQPSSSAGMWLGASATEQEKGFKLLLELA